IAKIPKLQKDIRGKIHIQSTQQFLAFMAAVEKPLTGPDPVETYGWQRHEAPKDLVKTLQAPYRDVTDRCYEMGYFQKHPEWTTYVTNLGY
ncbi:MAG: hypothetical protein Q9217_003661, partial [Psora testacea]